jgi:peptidoglycan/LPS O-acetylase OafA/YrhL
MEALHRGRFYSLDVLRGLAALSVVFWHWQHFFYQGTNPGAMDPQRLPLFNWFSILYTHGAWAVHLFFCLSGFVFFWLYSRAVAAGEIAFGRFAWLRLSRLYPLHIATLLLAAAGQLWMLRTQGTYFVVSHNDVGHFVLNLLFASSWGLERGYSFNGPSWSVSVEALLYLVFFAVCRWLPVRAALLIALTAAGFTALRVLYPPLGWGVGSFFIGGCALLAYQRIVVSPHAARATVGIACVTAGAWIATFMAALPEDAALLWTTVALFPLTILSLVLVETQTGSLGKRFSFLGDISYSVYLLHFPLQLWIVLLAARLHLDASVYYSTRFLGLFFTVLILLSLASYRWLERPAQNFLRRRLKADGMRS